MPSSPRKRAEAVVPDRLEMLTPLLEATEVTLFPSKYVPGESEPGDRVPLAFLLESWDQDAHYVQYVHADDTRLRKDSEHVGLAFSVMVVDLDAHDGQGTEEDYYRAILMGDLLDYPPNLAIKTKAGVHYLYLVAPIADPKEFEQKRLKLIEHVRHVENTTIFTVDDTKDWTRMFRAPRVVREDGTDLRDTIVWGCHDRVLDTGSWKVKAEPKPRTRRVRASGTPDLRAAAQYAAKVPGAISGQGGHNATFRLACALIRKFDLDEEQAFLVMNAWNALCDPPWSERDLEHKVRDAMKTVEDDDDGQ